jgi:predicted Zn-dependent protease
MKNILGFLFISFGVMVALKEEYHCKSYSEIFSKMTNSGDSPKSDISVDDQVIYISGLGDFNQSDLEFASKEVTKVFGINCEIIDPVKTTSELYSDNTRKLDKEKCASVLRPSNKTIYITNEYFDDENISGISMKNGKLVVVSNTCNHLKKTIFHELGHTFGMDHCDDNKCIMGTRNIMTCNGEFCNNCKTKLKIK